MIYTWLKTSSNYIHTYIKKYFLILLYASSMWYMKSEKISRQKKSFHPLEMSFRSRNNNNKIISPILRLEKSLLIYRFLYRYFHFCFQFSRARLLRWFNIEAYSNFAPICNIYKSLISLELSSTIRLKVIGSFFWFYFCF